MASKALTLVFIKDESRLLLGLKKRGLGEGKWNGFGGKVHQDETVVAGALRELREECGAIVCEKDLHKVGMITFEFEGDPSLHNVHIFTATKFEGEISESEEMLPRWFAFCDIPYDKMWVDDKLWYPIMLEDKKFKGYFLFRGHEEILKQNLRVCHRLDEDENEDETPAS